jgi:cellulose synthase/poly-beta-1,6-N-acetylglucosamine synthase-like glycosyltransferase
MCSHFTEDTAMVGGLTVIHDETKDPIDFFTRLQQLDWIFLQAIASGSAGIGLPVSILGNNFGFKRTVYNELGGFRSIGFSLTEDLALLRKIVSTTEFGVAYKLTAANMIESLPIKRFRDFMEQRKRWLRGGVNVNIWGWLMMPVSLLAHLMIIGGIFIFPGDPLFITAVIALSIIDFTLIWRIARRIKFKVNFLYFLVYELFFIFYTLLLSMSFISRSPIQWKDRTYNK